MQIALIGYGKMGKEIEKIALERGHSIVCTIDISEEAKFDSPEFRSADVAIEFTSPESAFQNYMRAFAVNVPVVSGSTGWLNRLEEVKQMCKKGGKTFFYASNFSLGVNIFFALNKYLAKLMNQFPDYDVRMEETHHIHKLDAPSGTAITLAEGIFSNIERKTKWVMRDTQSENEMEIKAYREGEVPGIHTVTYESEVDKISITHDAKNRQGFALGAVLAAEFTYEKTGFLGMEDMLEL
ncbi:MAG: 4-hydroxy-tetrahydrodipicolinate reductase [Dysgonamonadaceae bacterium]|jgi:4-hydroxy-tetrahydrodipicolinate reductase|nr:4-hydroxy-tetrahydrodipicolinate reductase [Dysgonamonadaceae bacterium]